MAEGHPPSPKHEGKTPSLKRLRVKPAMTIKKDWLLNNNN